MIQTKDVLGNWSETYVDLSGVARAAELTNFKMKFAPALNPDDGILYVRYYFGSTSGDVHDLQGIRIREVLSVSSSSPGAQQIGNDFRLPKPWSPDLLPNPPDGTIMPDEWGITYIRDGGSVAVTVPDVHGPGIGQTLDPTLLAQSMPGRSSYTIEQRLDYTVDNGVTWTPITTNNIDYSVVTSLSNGRLTQYYEVSMGGQTRRLLLDSSGIAKYNNPPPPKLNWPDVDPVPA